MDPTPLLELHELSAYYGYLQVLRNISLTMHEGSCIGLIGPNGAGKTTLIKSILGFVDIRGNILFQGKIVNKTNTQAFDQYRRDIGYLPEETSFYQHLSPREYLGMVGNLLDYEYDKIQTKVDTLIGYFSLDRWADRLTSELSKGNKQRLSLAVTFMQEPKLLLLDEPFSGLAPGGRRDLKDIINEYATTGISDLDMEQGTVLLSSHILGDLDELCTDFILMDQSGDIEWTGSKEEAQGSSGKDTIEDLYLSLIKE